VPPVGPGPGELQLLRGLFFIGELEELRELAQRELEALRSYEEEIARMERDRDAVLESYAGASSEALDSERGLYRGVVIEIASMYNFTNRMSLACGMIPNEEYHALAR
jgi:hypothetical protein